MYACKIYIFLFYLSYEDFPSEVFFFLTHFPFLWLFLLFLFFPQGKVFHSRFTSLVSLDFPYISTVTSAFFQPLG